MNNEKDIILGLQRASAFAHNKNDIKTVIEIEKLIDNHLINTEFTVEQKEKAIKLIEKINQKNRINVR